MREHSPFPCALLVAILFMLGSVTGCAEHDRAGLSGTVTLDGAPLPTGEIRFIPCEGTAGPTAGSPIKDGQYAVPVAKGAGLGKYRVTISSKQKTGRTYQSADQIDEEYAEVVPAKYNLKSELEYDLKPGANEINIDLTGRIAVEKGAR